MKTKTKRLSKSKQAFVSGDDITQLETATANVQLDGEDSIEAMFKSEQFANQNDVKELFHEDSVKARTDISVRQIKLITKAFYLAELTGMKEVKLILKDFLTLSISKDRKSRAEYVEALKSKIDNSIQQGMNGIRGQFGK